MVLRSICTHCDSVSLAVLLRVCLRVCLYVRLMLRFVAALGPWFSILVLPVAMARLQFSQRAGGAAVHSVSVVSNAHLHRRMSLLTLGLDVSLRRVAPFVLPIDVPH